MSTLQNNAPTMPSEALVRSPRQMMFQHAKTHRGLMLGGFVIAVIVLVALLAPLIAPHDPYAQMLSRKLIPPVWFDSPKTTWDHFDC